MTSTYTPPIRRKDSVGLIFSRRPDYDVVSNLIFEKLGIDADDIIGFQSMFNNKVVIKFSDRSRHEAFVNDYDEKVFALSDGLNVRIVNFSTNYTFVSIRYAPFDMDNESLVSILNKYGKVIDIRENKHYYGKAKGLLNGIRTAKMEVKRNIPSSLTVLGHTVSFIYSGQKKTCHKCGSELHLAVDCSIERMTRFNTSEFDTNFPKMPQEHRGTKKKEGKKGNDEKSDGEENKTQESPPSVVSEADQDDGNEEARNETEKDDIENEKTENEQQIHNREDCRVMDVNDELDNVSLNGNETKLKNNEIARDKMEEITIATQESNPGFHKQPVASDDQCDISGVSMGEFLHTNMDDDESETLSKTVVEVEVHQVEQEKEKENVLNKSDTSTSMGTVEDANDITRGSKDVDGNWKIHMENDVKMILSKTTNSNKPQRSKDNSDDEKMKNGRDKKRLKT